MLKFSKKELLNEISGTANERFQSIALYTYYILLNGASKTAESLKHQHGQTRQTHDKRNQLPQLSCNNDERHPYILRRSQLKESNAS